VISVGGDTNASPIVHPVYRPGTDGEYADLFQLIEDIRDNRKKSKDAERNHKEAIITESPQAIIVEQIQLHAPDLDTYTVTDLVWRRNGTAAVVVTEVKAGSGILSRQQVDALAETVRSGNVYIKNEDAAEALKIKPWVTFADQGILPEVLISGGNPEAIVKQFRNKGVEAIPGGKGPDGRPILRILRAARGGRAL
jgi:hypothetical protein